MAKRKDRARTDKMSTRVSVSALQDDDSQLKKIAANQRFSIAWVVRDPVAKYLSDRTRLPDRIGRGGGS